MSTYDIRYNRSSGFFNKSGQYRGRLKTDKSPRKKPKNADDPAKEDRKNREEVVKEIMERVNNGEKLPEVCNELVEKYQDKFKYLPAENLPNIFAGWYNGRARPRKEVEKVI